ncbi:hypothetical protein Tco_1203993 [Tanacetum coccineum]
MTEENVHALRTIMREIHASINNDLKVLTAVIEDIARVFLQDQNEEWIEKGRRKAKIKKLIDWEKQAITEAKSNSVHGSIQAM